MKSKCSQSEPAEQSKSRNQNLLKEYGTLDIFLKPIAEKDNNIEFNFNFMSKNSLFIIWFTLYVSHKLLAMLLLPLNF